MSGAYYNDFDDNVVAWTKELIKRGLIPDGEVDEWWRPVEARAQPLADGIPARVGRLRGYGNAINPHQAAHFIRTTYHD